MLFTQCLPELRSFAQVTVPRAGYGPCVFNGRSEAGRRRLGITQPGSLSKSCHFSWGDTGASINVRRFAGGRGDGGDQPPLIRARKARVEEATAHARTGSHQHASASVVGRRRLLVCWSAATFIEVTGMHIVIYDDGEQRSGPSMIRTSSGRSSRAKSIQGRGRDGISTQ